MSDIKIVVHNMTSANDNLYSTKPNPEDFTDFKNTKIDLNNCLYEVLTKKAKPLQVL